MSGNQQQKSTGQEQLVPEQNGRDSESSESCISVTEWLPLACSGDFPMAKKDTKAFGMIQNVSGDDNCGLDGLERLSITFDSGITQFR
jgi:hypothetical protein